MPVLPSQQQSDEWDSNIYVVTVTRILVVVGVTYLIRSVYQYVTRLRSPNNGNSVAATLDTGADLDLESLALGDPSALTLNIDVDETLNPPEPIYRPSQRPLRPQAHPHQHPRRHRSQRARSPLATAHPRMVNLESGGGRQTPL